MLRKIYMVEIITEDGDIHVRRFARNLKTAEHIARCCRAADMEAYIRPVAKRDWEHINLQAVEG